MDEIESAEKELDVKLPREYRAFLAKFGFVMWDGNYIAGIATSKTLGVVQATQPGCVRTAARFSHVAGGRQTPGRW